MARVILCALGDDDRLQDVVATGRALSEAGRFRPLFVHVAAPPIRLPPPLGTTGGSSSNVRGADPLSGSFEELVEQGAEDGVRLLRGAGIVEDESIVVTGDAVAQLNRLAEERDAALVVVGAARHGTLSGTLLGSVPHALVRDGARPVLIARGNRLPALGGPVVCGVDASTGESARRTVAHAAGLASSMGRRLILVHVLSNPPLPPGAGPVLTPVALEPTARERAAARRALEDLGRRLPAEAIETVVVSGTSVAACLDDVADERAADLLVVGRRARGPVRSAIGGSVSLELLRHARLPLVIVPPA